MKLRPVLLAAALCATSSFALAQDKVAYHLNDAKASGLATLRNIGNHLDTDPSAQIILVTHANGVDVLMEGATAPNGAAFAGAVSALASRGVKFEVCEITLKNRNLKRDQFILEAGFTPSGVVRLSKLQLAGYAYIKP